MSYVERRDHAVNRALDLTRSVPGFVAKDQYGLAALALRQASEAMSRAHDEQTCIDLARLGAIHDTEEQG